MTVDRPHPISLADGKEYVIGDAVDILSSIDDADLICLDDAWSRPYRGGQFGVEYDTHPFDHEGEDVDMSTKLVVDACMEALNPGGWLIADADDWLLPRLTSYLMKEYGDVNEDYGGGGYYDAQIHDQAVERGDELGEQARDRAAEAGILETTTIETAVETGPPARTIVEYADENDADQIVIGSHGRSGVSRVLLGSVAETVARRSPVPVTIVR